MLRIAINGLGRIGRHVLREYCARHTEFASQFEIVAINDIAPLETLAHLLKYDTTHGVFFADVNAEREQLQLSFPCNGELTTLAIPCFHQSQPAHLPWQQQQVDIVLECTGIFRAEADARQHLQAGAKRVVMGAVPFDRADLVAIAAVNGDAIQPEHTLISNASCTTHCIAPLLSVVEDCAGIQRVIMNEVHAYTSDQLLLDNPHRDPRRGRAAAQNIIPTTSSSINAVQQVLPSLQGKIQGHSLRVPTQNVALVNLVIETSRPLADADEIHAAFIQASRGYLQQVIALNHLPLVSQDFNGRRESAILDTTQTLVNGNLLQLSAWYDNETGYVNRMLELMVLLA